MKIIIIEKKKIANGKVRYSRNKNFLIKMYNAKGKKLKLKE